MTLSKKDMLDVAKLAKLALTENEEITLLSDLNKILDWVDELEKLKITDAITKDKYKNLVLEREDKNVISNLDILKNAPEREHGFFAVPKVVD